MQYFVVARVSNPDVGVFNINNITAAIRSSGPIPEELKGLKLILNLEVIKQSNINFDFSLAEGVAKLDKGEGMYEEDVADEYSQSLLVEEESEKELVEVNKHAIEKNVVTNNTPNDVDTITRVDMKMKNL